MSLVICQKKLFQTLLNCQSFFLPPSSLYWSRTNCSWKKHRSPQTQRESFHRRRKKIGTSLEIAWLDYTVNLWLLHCQNQNLVCRLKLLFWSIFTLPELINNMYLKIFCIHPRKSVNFFVGWTSSTLCVKSSSCYSCFYNRKIKTF